MRIDARLPLELREAPPPPRRDWLLLLPDGSAVPQGWLAVHRLPEPGVDHPVGCACCGPARGAFVLLLARLFQQRARGEVGFFRGIAVAAAAGEVASLSAACERDPYVHATFKLSLATGAT